MSERITEAELQSIEASAREYGNAVGDSCGECGADLLVPPLLAEVRRLRGIIVALDAAIEHASSGAVRAGERIVYLTERVPAFFTEARALREEQETDVHRR